MHNLEKYVMSILSQVTCFSQISFTRLIRKKKLLNAGMTSCLDGEYIMRVDMRKADMRCEQKPFQSFTNPMDRIKFESLPSKESSERSRRWGFSFMVRST